MKDWTTIREHYLQDELPVRLEGLAANLSRIKSFATHDANREVIESLSGQSWASCQKTKIGRNHLRQKRDNGIVI